MNHILFAVLLIDFTIGFLVSSLLWHIRLHAKTQGRFVVDRTGNNGRTVIKIEVKGDPEYFHEGDYLRVTFQDGSLSSKFDDELWGGESEGS